MNFKINKYLILLAAIMCPFLAAFGQNPKQLFTQGNEAYERENYPLAISLYKAALNYGHSAALHYNLGNAYYKNDDPGRSILHLEKALLLSPNDPEIQANLHFVRSALEIPQTSSYFLKSLSSRITYNQWLSVCILAFWLSICLIIFIKWHHPPKLFPGLALILTASIFFITLHPLYRLQPSIKEGVILDKDTQLKVAPTESSPNIAFLQPGHNVSIIKSQDKHFFIKYPFSNKEGWVLNTHCQPLWDIPFNN